MLQVAFLLDQTGSMVPRKEETILSFNQYVADLYKLPEPVELTLTLFNSSKVDVRYKKAKLDEVVPLNKDTYIPDDATPLLDAIAKAVEEVGDEKRCIFIILTDGQENSSRDHTKAQIKQLIEKKEGEGWQFVFMGIGGMDSVDEATSMGIAVYTQSAKGDLIGLTGTTASAVTSSYSAGVKMSLTQTQDFYDDMKKKLKAQTTEVDKESK